VPKCVPTGVMAAVLALLLASPAAAQQDDGPSGHWYGTTPNGVRQTVGVNSTQSGTRVSIGIQGQGAGTAGVAPAAGWAGNLAPSTTDGYVNPGRGPSPGGGGGTSVQWSRNGSGGGGGSTTNTNPGWVWETPTGGVNEVVRSGPMSSETETGGGGYAFGGTAIGGWTFPNIDPTQLAGAAGNDSVAVTTGWAAIGPVPQIDPWSVARSAESEAPLPRISLKVNPDPGRVALPSWFWLEGYNGGVITWSKTEHASHTECRLNEGVPECHSVDDSVTVNLQATPRLYEWTFGDDVDNYASFRDAQGLGRAYTDPNTPSPVAHAYHMSSIKYFKDGGYPLELRVTWAAAFSVNGGGSQGLPDVSQTYTARYQVRQIQSIVEH